MFKKNIQKFKKFTLAELLLVVGLLALLAAVVIPRVSVVRDNVRAAGVDSNLRIVQAYANSVVDNYGKDQAQLLEQELFNVFEGDTLVNPFNRFEGVKEISSIGEGAAIVYSDADNERSLVESTWLNNPEPHSNLEGAVLVSAYPNPTGSNTLEVIILPMDNNGRPILSRKVTITP